EVLREPRDAVQLALDRVAVVGGQHARVGEELLAAHDGDVGVVHVEPRGRRGVGGDVDVPDPRGERPHAAHGVAQLVDLAVARRARVGGVHLPLGQVAGAFGEVVGVVAVDPGEDDVDVEVDVVGVVVEHAGEGRPAGSVPLDGRGDRVGAVDAVAGERVGARRHDLAFAERPELETDGGLGDPPAGPRGGAAPRVAEEDVVVGVAG